MSPIDFEVKPSKAIVLNCGRKNILDDLSNSGSPFDYLVKAGNRPPADWYRINGNKKKAGIEDVRLPNDYRTKER